MATDTPQHSQQWQSDAELPQHVFATLRQLDRTANPIVVVATVDPDGSPRTAPFGSLRAITPRVMRFACDRRHTTFSNLIRDRRGTVALLAPANIAVSIRGRARVVKEQMSVAHTDAIVEIAVEEVKNNAISGVEYAIQSGVTVAYPGPVAELVERYIAEVEEV